MKLTRDTTWLQRDEKKKKKIGKGRSRKERVTKEPES